MAVWLASPGACSARTEFFGWVRKGAGGACSAGAFFSGAAVAIDYGGVFAHPLHMVVDGDIKWIGWGRWLSFALSALLLLGGALDLNQEAAAGWNIFLGLLLFGVIASGHRKAPLLALVLTGLMAVRLLFAIIMYGPYAVRVIGSVVPLALAAGAAYNLRKQVMSP